MLEIRPNIKCTHFQSGGPTAQYKNKNNFYLFTLFCKKLKLERATWNFTSAVCVKSAAEGIDGTKKSMSNDHKYESQSRNL